MATKLLKHFNYSEGEVNLNLTIDVERPNHIEETDQLLALVEQAQKDIKQYRETLKK